MLDTGARPSVIGKATLQILCVDQLVIEVSSKLYGLRDAPIE